MRGIGIPLHQLLLCTDANWWTIAALSFGVWVEAFLNGLSDWLKNPAPSLLALALGGYAGFYLSRIRHQGKIDALEERLKHKDEQIKVKDEAIGAMSTTAAARSEKAQASPSGEAKSKPDLLPQPKDNKFRTINDQISRNIEANILHAIKDRRFNFVFNPKTGQSKTLTFLDNGSIGEGRNSNEWRSKIENGLLEILDANGRLYSRFTFVPHTTSFHHTNEQVTQSIKGQYLIPVN